VSIVRTAQLRRQNDPTSRFIEAANGVFLVERVPAQRVTASPHETPSATVGCALTLLLEYMLRSGHQTRQKDSE
jgi:hypothetical protein